MITKDLIKMVAEIKPGFEPQLVLMSPNALNENATKFYKSLAKYYHGWFRDCHDSAVYCMNKGNEIGADMYLFDARRYLEIILDNYDAIEFFRIGDNAFKYDEVIPEQFRGYD